MELEAYINTAAAAAAGNSASQSRVCSGQWNPHVGGRQTNLSNQDATHTVKVSSPTARGSPAQRPSRCWRLTKPINNSAQSLWSKTFSLTSVSGHNTAIRNEQRVKWSDRNAGTKFLHPKMVWDHFEAQYN